MTSEALKLLQLTNTTNFSCSVSFCSGSFYDLNHVQSPLLKTRKAAARVCLSHDMIDANPMCSGNSHSLTFIIDFHARCSFLSLWPISPHPKCHKVLNINIVCDCSRHSLARISRSLLCRLLLHFASSKVLSELW
jgi:hypothetical protein